MNKQAFEGFTANFFGVLSSIDVQSKGVAGTKDFVAWEWYLGLTPKEDVPAFGMKKGELTRLNGTSLMWWKKEAGAGGYEGWKIAKVKDYSSPAPPPSA